MGNIVLIIIGILTLLGGGYLIFRRGTRYQPTEEPERTQEYLVERVQEAFHEILTTNVAALYLNEEETKKKERLKEQLRTALRTCSYGDIRAKEYVKEHIRDILLEECGIGEDTINSYFKFSGQTQSGQDKFDILLYLYKKEWQYGAMEQLLKRLSKGRLEAGESLEVSKEDLEQFYEEEAPDLSYGDKVSILVQRIYQIYKGNGAIDEIRDMNIDGVSAGVSGISDTFLSIKKRWQSFRNLMTVSGFFSEERQSICPSWVLVQNRSWSVCAKIYIVMIIRDSFLLQEGILRTRCRMDRALLL